MSGRTQLCGGFGVQTPCALVSCPCLLAGPKVALKDIVVLLLHGFARAQKLLLLLDKGLWLCGFSRRSALAYTLACGLLL